MSSKSAVPPCQNRVLGLVLSYFRENTFHRQQRYKQWEQSFKKNYFKTEHDVDLTQEDKTMHLVLVLRDLCLALFLVAPMNGNGLIYPYRPGLLAKIAAGN